MGRNNASLIELKHLSYLRILEIEVPDVEMYPKDLLSGNQLIEYKIAIGSSFLLSAVKNNSGVLQLARCQSIIQECDGVNMLLKRAEALVLEEFEDVETILNDFRINGFSNLKFLRVNECGKIEYLVDTRERMLRVLPVVEILVLQNMEDLRQLCHGRLPSTSFSELRELWLDNLPELINCWEDPIGHVEGAATQEDEIVLLKLEELRLTNLPNLVSFCCKTNSSASDSNPHVQAYESLFNRKVVFPALERLYLNGLKNMKKLWHGQLLPAENFKRLRKLSISNCENLIIVFPSNLIQNLEGLSISNCDLLEELCEGHNATSITLPRITNLELKSLPRLKDIWWNKISLESFSFQNLKELTIGGCNCFTSRLEAFGSSKTSNLKKIWQNELPIVSFGQLRFLSLRECNNTLQVVPSQLLSMLHNLENLVVGECI
ncbi:unnamed protein product [Ilex paraguariensis]|uniref:Disease resistance protein At4g27190-like leucine-rich repeats domain-containing protein n=1 Tax=Ilex paraguariensis TaxID=185542 RepID=A0ABC8UUY4_9AQUA